MTCCIRGTWTDVVVSEADFEVERGPNFGTPLLSPSTDLPPPSVPDENEDIQRGAHADFDIRHHLTRGGDSCSKACWVSLVVAGRHWQDRLKHGTSNGGEELVTFLLLTTANPGF